MTEETAQVAQAAAADQDAGRLSEANRGRLILAVLSVALLSEIIPFTYSLAMVITPLVGKSFPSAGAQVSWMLTILGVVSGGTIALVTKMADLWGKKKLILIAAVVFWVGTIICAFTSSWPLFLVGRGMEAIAIGLSALCYSIVRDVMPRAWVPVTIGFIGTGIGISGVAAPLIGGLLTLHYSWRSVFWFMVIYMVVAVPLFAFAIPETKVRLKAKLDYVGAIGLGAGVAGVLVYLSEGQSWGWGTLSALGYLIAGLVILALFVVWESRISDPLIDLKLVSQPKVAQLFGLSFFWTGGFTLLTVAASYMFLGLPNLVTVITQEVYSGAEKQLHLSTLPPGLKATIGLKFNGSLQYAAGFDLFQVAWHILLAGSVAAMIFGPLTAHVARKVPSKRPLAGGLALLIATFVGLTFLHANWWEYLIFFIVGNLAMGTYYGIAPNLLIDVVPKQTQTINAGLSAGIGAIGSSFATAAFTAIQIGHEFSFTVNEPKGPGGKMIPVTTVPSAQVYTMDGYTWVFVMGIGFALVAAIIGVFLRAGQEPLKGGLVD